MKLGACFAWHTHPWEDLLALVRRAEALGFDSAFVDGDISMLERRREADVLDGWTTTTALLARTGRIRIGSIRLVHQWNAARLAQAAATAERITPGRLRFLLAIGDTPADRRFGFPVRGPGERIEHLDEMLGAIRALWRGETVTCRGRYVQLDGARVRPTPPGGRLPIALAARRRRMLGLVAAHADVWDVNLPPVADRVARAAELLAAACRERGRDPSQIARTMLVYTRVDPRGDTRACLAEYRRLNPWFDDVPDAELKPALVLGDARSCREQLAALARELGLALPVADLSGLDARASAAGLAGLAGENHVDAGT
jgi:alkanesulfonate monooxygenase SsuD/methylene tetrahydromethanopterin reductase-like flavin-dependent oxidoreductase (luciferase family)